MAGHQSCWTPRSNGLTIIQPIDVQLALAQIKTGMDVASHRKNQGKDRA